MSVNSSNQQNAITLHLQREEELRCLRERIAALDLKLQKMAAENARLKAAAQFGVVKKEGVFSGDDSVFMGTRERIVPLKVKTPATDAFLAEVRAQGVEMFASKCKEESKRAHSSDTRDSWWVSGENADDFAAKLRKERR